MNEIVRTLIVEDNPADVELILDALVEARQIQVEAESVQRLSEAISRISSGGIDIIMTDLGLPDSQDLSTYRDLRSAAPDLPIIVLTGNDDEDLAVAAVREGAQDVLVKNRLTRDLLIRAVRYAIERKRVAAELLKAFDQIKTLRGIMPICASCKKIRDDEGYWQQVEVYVRDHTEAQFSHGICPECMVKLYTKRNQAADLHKRADKIDRIRTVHWPENPSALSLEESRRVLREVRVQQIELEMQNEELQRAKVELEAARARYFDLYDNAPVGYLSVSATGLIVEGNSTAAAMLGLAQNALVKFRLSRFIFKEDKDSYDIHRKQVFESSTPQSFVVRIVRLDGTRFWAHLTATASQDSIKTPRRTTDGASMLRIAVNDITERLSAEQALLQSHKEFKELFEHAPVGYHEIDKNGNIVRINATELRMLGFDAEELLYQPALPAYIGETELCIIG